jgi:hypothetical protein
MKLSVALVAGLACVVRARCAACAADARAGAVRPATGPFQFSRPAAALTPRRAAPRSQADARKLLQGPATQADIVTVGQLDKGACALRWWAIAAARRAGTLWFSRARARALLLLLLR